LKEEERRDQSSEEGVMKSTLAAVRHEESVSLLKARLVAVFIPVAKRPRRRKVVGFMVLMADNVFKV
jgi:hypothetical protein